MLKKEEGLQDFSKLKVKMAILVQNILQISKI